MIGIQKQNFKMSDKIVVICAGLPRTGTTSMKIALEDLLGGKCYHMYTFMHEGTEDDINLWRKALDGKATKDDWIEFFKVVQLSIDIENMRY